MSRIRTIKPEFWKDERVARLSPRARLLFIGLWNFADDVGIARGAAAYLRAEVFPYDDVPLADIERCMAELEREALARRFQVEGQTYLAIRSFTKHQNINRPSGARYPKPPADLWDRRPNSVSPHGALTEDSLGDHPIPSHPIPSHYTHAQPKTHGGVTEDSLSPPPPLIAAGGASPLVVAAALVAPEEPPAAPQQIQALRLALVQPPPPKRPRRGKAAPEDGANSPPPGGRQAMWVAIYAEEFQRALGTPYIPARADYILAAQLLSGPEVTEELVRDRARKCFHPGLDDFHRCGNFRKFATKFSDIGAARIRGSTHNVASVEALNRQVAKYGNDGEL